MALANRILKFDYELRLISFLSEDKLVLPGLLYLPTKPTTKAAIWLHGMGDNGIFYNPTRLNALGTALVKNGVALLAFNNRGAHHQKWLKIANLDLPDSAEHYLGGTHYEIIADAVKDIDGATDYLTGMGYETLYLLGHSSGASKICVYADRKTKTAFSKYVLAGPGDDIGISYHLLGKRKFWQAIDYARQAIDRGAPKHIMPKYTGLYPFSAQSALDWLDPDGDYNVFPYYEAEIERIGQGPLFGQYQKLNQPTLVIIGENDEFTPLPGGATQALDVLLRHTSNAMLKQTDFMVVPGSDHGFHEHEAYFAEKVAEWLT